MHITKKQKNKHFKHTGFKAEVSWLLLDFDVAEVGLGRGQTWTSRPRVRIAWVHQLLLETVGREEDDWIRQVALVQRPALAAGGVVRRVRGFLWRQEGQAGIRQLPVEPGRTRGRLESSVEMRAKQKQTLKVEIRVHLCSVLKAAAAVQPMGACRSANCWFWLACGRFWRWKGLEVGARLLI